MIIYWCPQTRAIRTVWMAEELGVDYDLVLIDVRNPGAQTDPAFRRASPMGKVPAIKDGDVEMADSAAICLYLADCHPDAGLAPAIGDAARGQYLYWMIFTPGVLEPAMAEKLGGWPAARASHGWGDWDSMIETLEGGLAQGPWIMGEMFTAADVMLGSSLNFLRMFGIMPDNQVLNAYCDRCLERPAFQRALARETSE